MFEKMDEQLLDAMCDRLKPVLYTENSFIAREGDPVDEMLFVMRGNLLTMTTNSGRTGFFNSIDLKAGDFCGEALLTWALDPNSSSSLPTSTRTGKAITYQAKQEAGFSFFVSHISKSVVGLLNVADPFLGTQTVKYAEIN